MGKVCVFHKIDVLLHPLIVASHDGQWFNNLNNKKQKNDYCTSKER